MENIDQNAVSKRKETTDVNSSGRANFAKNQSPDQKFSTPGKPEKPTVESGGDESELDEQEELDDESGEDDEDEEETE